MFYCVSMRSGYLPPYTRLRELSATEWDALVARHPHGHLLQTHAWGRLKAAHGWHANWSAIFTNREQPIGMVMMLMRALPYGLGRIGYVPHGPVVDWDDEASAAAALHAVRSLGCRLRVFATVVEPDLLDTPSDQRLLARLGLKPAHFSVQPRRTIWVNLDVDEDVDMLAAMKPKTRYNIRLAERHGVSVRRIDPIEGADADLLYEMYAETARRDGFLIRPAAYYLDAWRALGGVAFIADHEGHALAGLVLLCFADRAWYFYGMSRNVGREHMPNYLLQWVALRWARDQGYRIYDWWGAPDTLSPNDPLWGVYRFKEGFGAQLVEGLGAWDFAPFPALYTLYNRLGPRLIRSGLAG